MGASVESLSRLQYAARISDVPVEALTGAIDHLHEVLGRAELGSGRAGKALANMGVDAKKLLDLPFEEQLAVIANKLAGIPDPSQRAAREMVLFGEAGAKLDPLLRQGAAGIQRLAEESDSLGLTIDGHMTQKLKEAHEEMIKADETWDHAATTLGAALAPAIEGAAKLFEKFANGITVSQKALQNFFGGPDTQLAALTQSLDRLKDKRDSLLNDLQGLQGTNTFISVLKLGSPQEIEQKKQELAAIEQQMDQVNEKILDIQRKAEAAKPSNAGGNSNVAPVDLGVTIDQQKIFTDKMTELLDQFQHDTETDTEKVAQSWYKLDAELKDLRDEGLISQQEYAKRLKESLDQILPGADEVKGKFKPFEDQLTELQKLGEKTAQSIEKAFANFLYEPFGNSARKMALDFVNALRRMAADAAAADIFKHLFPQAAGEKGKNTNDSFAPFLEGLFSGKFFEGTPSGVSPGGESTTGKVLGGLAGLFGKVIGGLFGGGGGGGFGGVGDDSLGAGYVGIPQMAEGGLVSAGSSYLVGEDGPELFTAASHGIITPNNQLGGGSPTINLGDTHIDARGADAERIMTLMPPLIAKAQGQMAARMLMAFRRNGLAAPARI